MHDLVVTVRAPAHIILVSFLLLALMFTRKANISAVYASPDIHQGDLIIAGNDVYIIENQRFDINGSIIVEENATLILMNATLNFTQTENYEFNMTFQNPVNGNPHLQALESEIISDFPMQINFFNNSTANVSDLEVGVDSTFVKAHDSSHLLVSDSLMYSIVAYGSSIVNVTGSELNDICSRESSFIEASGCNISLVSIQENSHVLLSNCTVAGDLYASELTIVELSESTLADVYASGSCKTTFMNRLNVNGSIIVEDNATLILKNAIINFTQTYDRQHHMIFQNPANGNPRLQVENATITASNYRLLVYFYGNSSATISNLITAPYIRLEAHHSSFLSTSNSTIWELETTASSVVWLVNSTCNSYFIYPESKVYVYWYLDVHVVDSIDQDVPSANVTATYPNATVAESKLTDANGWARLTLTEKMMNATGSYPVGNYTVTAEYEVYTGQQSVNMTGNKEITITLPFIIPEFPPALMLPLFTIATLLAVIIYRRKHSIQD